MAVAATKIPAPTGAPAPQDAVFANKRVRPRRLTFSGNYATGGETIAASLFNLDRIEHMIVHAGVAMASDVATGCPVGWNPATSKIVMFEGSAAGTAVSEKTNAEVYPTGCFLDVTAIGY